MKKQHKSSRIIKLQFFYGVPLKGYVGLIYFWRTIGLQCYHSLRIMYLAYYVFGESRPSASN